MSLNGIRPRLTVLAGLLLSLNVQAADPLTIDVHRDANCGCCKAWMAHMEDNGFKVNDHVETDMITVKMRLGVAPQLASCHTAVIDGKFVEGHVPAAQVLELQRRDDLLGVAVPGMPLGSPGMEYNNQYDAYQVIGITSKGAEVIAEYPGR